MTQPDSYEAAKRIVQRLRSAGHEALLAGGCVRDQLLGREPKDHDIATSATPEQVCRLFRRTKRVGAQFGVVLVSLGGCEIEVATFRIDEAYEDGRRPASVRFASAQEDAQRRDFTINGMFFDPLADEIVDYVGGRRDLEARLVRCIGVADERFAEDHLRMLRAVRFAARLGFEIETGTFEAIRRHAPRIAQITPERIRMELQMILGDPGRARGWRLIVETGLANHLVSGVAWTDEQACRAECILAHLPEEASSTTALAAALQCFGAAAVGVACRNLRCSNEVIDTAQTLVTWAGDLLSDKVWQLADMKMLRATGLFEQVVSLARAIAAADNLPAGRVDHIAAAARKIAEADVAPPPLVTGDDLLALEIRPGPLYGRTLAAVYRAQLNEELATRDEALELMKKMAGRQDK